MQKYIDKNADFVAAIVFYDDPSETSTDYARYRLTVNGVTSPAAGCSRRGRTIDRRAAARRPSSSPGINSAAMDVMRATALIGELPRERTQLLDNLGRLRREVRPNHAGALGSLADHMNLRRGDVHEVVSFYSFLQVPVDAVRVCTGPVCDWRGGRELLARNPGAIEGPVPRALRARACAARDTVVPRPTRLTRGRRSGWARPM